jgi:hypothetical protein
VLKETSNYDLDVKIFVSHRIDKDTKCIDNPLYTPIRCGAVFDCKNRQNLLGDDTGDNISEKRESFAELTVQYWIWKNVKADYYGLCHYQRYLIIPDSELKPTEQSMVVDSEPFSRELLRFYGLDNPTNIVNEIENYDMIVPLEFSVTVDTMQNRGSSTVYDWLLDWVPPLVRKSHLDKLLKLISERHPALADKAMDYMAGSSFRGFNCFVMRADLFREFCEFEFPLLFELENELDFQGWENTRAIRTLGYFGEILFSIWVNIKKQKGGYRIKEVPLVKFMNVHEGKEVQESRASRTLKTIARTVSPAYRSSLNIANHLTSLRLPPAPPNIRQVTIAACLANVIHETHKNSFGPYKDAFLDRDLVVVGTGPTLNYYEPLKSAVHIGLNTAFRKENIKFDFLFTHDFSNRQKWLQDLGRYDCVKFFGTFTNRGAADRGRIPDSELRKAHAKRYYLDYNTSPIELDIEYMPLMDWMTVAHAAIQFALYTSPRRVYLVGLDTTQRGHFDDLGHDKYPDLKYLDSVFRGYREIRNLVKLHYPDIEIISINPVGLRDYFTDYFTDEFIADNPDVMLDNDFSKTLADRRLPR